MAVIAMSKSPLARPVSWKVEFGVLTIFTSRPCRAKKPCDSPAHSGQLKPLSGVEEEVYKKLRRRGKKKFGWLNQFQDSLAYGRPHDWRCRAGARYLYICEDGLVHYCSQQRGYPAVPLETYTIDDIRRAFSTPKPCAPYCTVGCVHRVSTMDFWRNPQHS